jgi:hypothetical protein
MLQCGSRAEPKHDEACASRGQAIESMLHEDAAGAPVRFEGWTIPALKSRMPLRVNRSQSR